MLPAGRASQTFSLDFFRSLTTKYFVKFYLSVSAGK